MHALQLVPLLLAVGCFLAPAEKGTPPVRPLPQLSDPFPAPKTGLSITVAPGEEMSLAKLLDEFSRVTGHNLLISTETCNGLKNTPTGLNRSVEVPREEVYPLVERILGHNGFAFALLNEREPRLLGVYNVAQGQHRPALRELSTFVPSDRIAAYARHPAVLVTTMVDLPSTDVRTLSNSMRTMFADANTQQIVPVGNSNSLILYGYGSTISDLVSMLRLCDESSRIAEEKHEKEREAARRARDEEQQRRMTVPTPEPAKEEEPK